MTGSVRRRWIAAWLGGALIGVANGVAREATYGKTLSERAAHNVSGITAVTGFAGYFLLLQRRWPIPSVREALTIGASWVGLTVAFEFGFGRVITKQTWEELLADYNVAEGRTWPMVLAWIALGPAGVRHLRPPRSRAQP
jgi:hypothetical protein